MNPDTCSFYGGQPPRLAPCPHLAEWVWMDSAGGGVRVCEEHRSLVATKDPYAVFVPWAEWGVERVDEP